MTLQEYYVKLITYMIYAGKKYDSRFIFKFKGKYYLAEFRKGKWQEPREILFVKK